MSVFDNTVALSELVNDYLENEILSVKGISNEIYNPCDLKEQSLKRIFLRKYRKYATTESVRDFVRERLTNIIDNNLPMTFVPSFGGYKHWWAPTYPSTDWAEVFNVKFLLEYLAPIYNSYNNVSIEYESEEVILAELNNIPQSGLDQYTKTFREVLSCFQNIIGDRTKLSLVLAREQYEEVGFSKELLLKRIEEMMDDYTKRFDSYEPDDQARRIAKVKTNFKLDGEKKYIGLTDEQIYEIYKNSRVLNEAFLDADYEVRGESFFDAPSTIPLLFSFGLGPGGEAWPHIGSSSSSMVDFWAGIGILELRTDDDGDSVRIVPRIISQSQYKLLESDLVRIPVKTKLSEFKNTNYDYIYIYKGTLSF